MPKLSFSCGTAESDGKNYKQIIRQYFIKIISPKAAQVALRRQQQNSNLNPSSPHCINSLEYIEKIQSMENLLAQKRAYQKQLKSIQQSSYNKSLMNRGM